MRILVTGHDGYIGSVMVPLLQRAGHDVHGIDSSLYEGCDFGPGPGSIPSIRMDVRDVTEPMLEGFDVVIHMAAISNDPLADLDAACTDAVNRAGSVRLARVAREAGVPRFVFASSCSLYGSADPSLHVDESAPQRPVTAYGWSKVRSEREMSELASDRFSPVFLRNATVYGVSPRLRADVVVNNLVGAAHTTGTILLQSDGSPWRPLVHVEDLSRAFLAVAEAPRELVHNQAFNVGATSENYQISEIADIVADVMPETSVACVDGAGPDPRCYRVDFSKFEHAFPGAAVQWDVRRGVEELASAYDRYGLTTEEFLGDRFTRLRRIRTLLDEGRLDDDLRWREPAALMNLGAGSR